MSRTATEDALGYCARIRDLILHHDGGWADGDALEKFRLLSGGASRAVDNAQGAELMRTAFEYASDLFSGSDHQKWATGRTSGADILRLCILAKLDAFRARVVHLQAAARGRDALDADRMYYPKDE